MSKPSKVTSIKGYVKGKDGTWRKPSAKQKQDNEEVYQNPIWNGFVVLLMAAILFFMFMPVDWLP